MGPEVATRNGCTMRDIFEELLARADIGIAVLAPNWTVERASTALARLLGREPDSLAAFPLLDVMPVSDRLHVRGLLSVLANDSLGTVRAVVRVVRPDGAIIVLKSVFTRIGEGEDERIIALLSDITAEEEALEQKRRQEEHLLRAYADLVYSITGGRLLIVNELELLDQLGSPVFGPAHFDDEIGPSRVRHAAREAVLTLDEVVWDDGFELGFGELLVNALTHAGGGRASLHVCGDVLQAVVQDDGAGVDFTTITRAALDSPDLQLPVLGIGFTLMLSFADRMLISTGPTGSMMVLEKASPAPE
ncbi:MAG TPA: ATP-binding protein [Coriobacteriia bacterium]|nr:ATP-binding protein [Coriobacteriia bacterium]